MNDKNKRQYAHSIRLAVRAAVLQANNNLANIHIPTTGQRGAVIGIINRIAGGDDNRKLLLGWLFADEGESFARLSSKTLDDAQWAALYAWCEFRKDEERILWVPKESFTMECLAVLSAAMDDYFNLSFSEQAEMPEPPEIVASAVGYGGGEITHTGVKTVGVKGTADSAFQHDKPLASPETPPSPYVKVNPGPRISTEQALADLGFEQDEKPVAPVQKAVKPIPNKKPRLYNPFE